MDPNRDLENLLKAHLTATEQRFDRLDSKIDSLSEVVVSLARAETKLIGLEESRLDQGKRLGKLEENFHELKEETGDNTAFRVNLTRAFWIILSAVATVGLGVYLA